MKHIMIRNFPNMKAKEILLVVARAPEQGKGIAYDEMAKRVRILDALEAIDDATISINMEDADYELLVKLVKAYPFAVADRSLLAILSDVVEAKQAVVSTNGSGGKETNVQRRAEVHPGN